LFLEVENYDLAT